jgi:hypothetical protein
MTITRILLVLGIIGCLQCWCGPAHAGEVRSALSQLCGHRAQRFAPLVVVMAKRHDIPWRVLVANVAAESHCNSRADSGKGDIGLGQIRVGGSAAGKYTRLQLLRPRLNMRLTARHLRRCFDLCGWWVGALSVYKGHRRCRASKGARRVMELAKRIGFDERNGR